RVAVVAPRARVHDHAVDVVVRVVDPVDELALVVRLPAASVQVELVRPRIDAALELVQAQAAVDPRVAPAERVEVRAVEDEDLHQSAMRLSSADRTSSGGRASTVGPCSPSKTRLIAPPVRFLSRKSACQARSRSTSTGCGSSASTT